ncbi:MAG: ABC transporter substrate-binding protein [Bradyrhizobium sp.]|uniref:TAXI family TRAP transporter solute-binding subunit n=1 Tax=Bradyrhizobium sp. TaxID=376 RepID=UPI001C28CED7|nr:TAXI family TRAP transporter solute-binding subunit [Bradyrhizobium sp.]MBU6461172.1 ABC transporter substrate-binding protein [Pseudomonadota bacterium]MDE2066248.1 ABC transporter substrate-binding protein [Bradyrhizobium sp.]MDE2241875.1 ABC transporter substrate-binding protein [Bradyrhizobium sp.]MDE2473197.1 ABC transporter substrate-binding protein [Bradyrhizobium sp.]
MKSLQIALPFWVRAILLIGVVCILAGAGLISYRLYMRPRMLTIAVGSLDGEAKQVVSLIASRLATTDARIRLKVENAGSVLDAAKAFDAGNVDLAVVRADVGDLQQARTVALTAHGVVMIIAPPGSTITSIAKLRGHTVGVVGGEINHRVVEALKKEYDLGRANVMFKDIAPLDTRRALQTKEVSALLLVLPLTERYLTLVKSLFREGPNSSPILIPIDSAGAIAEVKGPYESFDIPKGTLRGAPPVPEDDVTTLRVGFYLVANKRLSSSLVAELTKNLMSVRRDLLGEQPLLAGIAAPDTDPDAFIAVHPGAAAFYNGTEESFMDRYGNAIYLTPMVLGAMASVFAAAWRFLGVRPIDPAQATLDMLCGLPGRIRKTDNEAELASIEEEVDAILHAQLARATDHEESASEAHALIAAAHRIDNLIHHRRMVLAARISPAEKPG